MAKLFMDTEWFDILKDYPIEKQNEVMQCILHFNDKDKKYDSSCNLWQRVIKPALTKSEELYHKKVRNLENNASKSKTNSNTKSDRNREGFHKEKEKEEVKDKDKDNSKNSTSKNTRNEDTISLGETGIIKITPKRLIGVYNAYGGDMIWLCEKVSSLEVKLEKTPKAYTDHARVLLNWRQYGKNTKPDPDYDIKSEMKRLNVPSASSIREMIKDQADK